MWKIGGKKSKIGAEAGNRDRKEMITRNKSGLKRTEFFIEQDITIQKTKGEVGLQQAENRRRRMYMEGEARTVGPETNGRVTRR